MLNCPVRPACSSLAFTNVSELPPSTPGPAKIVLADMQTKDPRREKGTRTFFLTGGLVGVSSLPHATTTTLPTPLAARVKMSASPFLPLAGGVFGTHEEKGTRTFFLACHDNNENVRVPFSFGLPEADSVGTSPGSSYASTRVREMNGYNHSSASPLLR
jgi:hypothetical protein